MNFSDRDGFIWMDGKLVPWRDANVHVLTHTLHYGMGVFEGVRAYQTECGTAVFRLREHTDRLFRSAHILNMSMPFDKDTLNEAQLQVIRENKLDSAYVRPIAYLGSEGMGLRADNLSVHVAIATWEWGAYLGAENLERGSLGAGMGWPFLLGNLTLGTAFVWLLVRRWQVENWKAIATRWGPPEERPQ